MRIPKPPELPATLFHPPGELAPGPFRVVYPTWKSWVRTGPDRIGDLSAAAPFAADQVAALDHPALRGLSDRQRRALLAQHLFGYLDATVFVELDLVNAATHDLASGLAAGLIDDAIRLDAIRIYGDEAAHSSFSLDLRQQATRQVGTEPVAVPPHGHAKSKLALSLANGPADELPWRRLFHAVASETLITANLSRVARDPSVNPVVRSVLQDHAEDEALHHRFFSQVLRALWPRLTADGRRTAVRSIVDALDALLLPDAVWLAATLDAIGIPDPYGVAHELTASPVIPADARIAAGPTLALLKALGAFDDDDDDDEAADAVAAWA